MPSVHDANGCVARHVMTQLLRLCMCAMSAHGIAATGTSTQSGATMRLSRRRITREQYDAAWWRKSRYKSQYPKRKSVYESVPVFQAAFKEWLAQARHRLVVPVRIRQRSSRALVLSFVNYPANLSVWVTPPEISVAVTWQGEFIDFLSCYDLVAPVEHEGCILCEFCVPQAVVRYPTLREFWVAHSFEPLADWINEKLSPAGWLGIYRSLGGSTWARLYTQQPESSDDALCILPLPRKP